MGDGISLPNRFNAWTLCAIPLTILMRKEIFGFTLLFCSLFCVSSCSSKKDTCTDFRTGKFRNISKFTRDTLSIERNDTLQIETNYKTGEIHKGRVYWVSDCEYYLTYLTPVMPEKLPDSVRQYIQSHQLKVSIIKTTTDYYIFNAHMDGIKETLTDTMWVLK